MLNALSSASLGLNLDNKQLCLAVFVRLDIPICHPHKYSGCDANICGFARMTRHAEEGVAVCLAIKSSRKSSNGQRCLQTSLQF